MGSFQGDGALFALGEIAVNNLSTNDPTNDKICRFSKRRYNQPLSTGKPRKGNALTL